MTSWDRTTQKESEPDEEVAYETMVSTTLTASCLPQDGIVSRAQKKAAQRELRPALIMQQPSAYIDLFVAATKKEEASWSLWSPVVPLPDHEADAILANPSLKSRILTARSAYRDKASGSVAADAQGITSNLSEVRAKCRVVLRGYRDPDLELLSRHSP
eukprot:3886608-Amphidinium_carterae.1